MALRKSLDDMNNGIAGWAKGTKSEVINELNALGVKHYKNSPNKVPLRKAIKDSVRKRFDSIDRISYKIPRSAIFLHKGVSRGHGKSNPRKAKEFYNPIVDKRMDELADIVAEGQGNIIVNSLNIK